MPRILLVGWDDVSWKEATASVCPRLAAFRATAYEAPLAFSHPVCSQTRAAILFGSYGKKIGTLRDIGSMVVTPDTPPASLPTLPGTLKAAGYRTCLIGKWHCGPATSGAHWAFGPLERGYCEWLAGTRLNLASYTDWQRVDANALGFSVQEGYSQYATLAQLNAAAAWWGLHSAEADLFLHVALNAPHVPLHAPPTMLLAGWPRPLESSSDREFYRAMLRSADTVFGQLLDMVGPDVAVFLYSDNGTPGRSLPPGSDHTKAKTTTFDGGIRVLGLGRWTGCPVGTSPGLQHIQDIAAGVLAVAGVPAPPEWDARTTPRYSVLSEAVIVSSGVEDRACRTTTHKLRQVDGLEELYWLEVDPTESSPLDLLAPENQSVLSYLRGKLDAAAI